jgi:hypothetical protein
MQRLRITAVCFQYTFVFMWTPAMEARTTVPPAEIPFGLIFASFMVSSIQFIASQPRTATDARSRRAQSIE